MKKVYSDNLCYVWETNTGRKIVAEKCFGGSAYWNVTLVLSPGNCMKLGTRCTWGKVLDFCLEYDGK